MEVKFYTTKETPNTIKKTKELITAVYGNSIEPLDISNPTIKVKINEALLKANFAYIDKFKRFYFIKTITISKGFMDVVLTVDVLESFKEDILNYNGIINRQEFDYNLDLEDNEMSAYSKRLTTYKKFPLKPLDTTVTSYNRKYVMVTISK